MQLLVLYAVCVVGTLFPPLNPDLAAIGLATRESWHPVLIGLVAALGQSTTYALAYFFGARFLLRWKWLATRVEAVRVRYADHLERRYLVVVVVSGLVGLPPPFSLAALAPGFQVPFSHLLAVMFASRFAHFCVVAAFGATYLAGLFGTG